MTFTRRLVAGTFLVLVFTISVVVWTAERALRQDLEADLAAGLEREARLVAAALPEGGLVAGAALHRFTGPEERLSLLDPAGRLVADSDLRPDQLAATPPEADLPEVAAALQGRRGTARRVNATTSQPALFVAVAGGPGVVRMASSLAPVEVTVRHARNALLGGAAIALLVGGLLALVAGRSVAQPLLGLAAAARAIAQGSPPRFPRSGVTEVDALAQALRAMHRELTDRFAELRAERAESTTLVEAMVEGVLAADARGRVVTANPAARRLLGYGPAEPLPTVHEIFRLKQAREVVSAVMQGEPVQNREVELDTRTLVLNARPLGDGGAVLVLHDITEQRRLELVRRDFVANVSHELKTPLTSISGYAETLLGDAPDPETAQRFLAIIHGNARRMQRLVDDLLDLSRLEAGRWQPKPQWVDVGLVAREVWAGLAERAGQRRVTLEVATDAGDVPCYADPDAVRQILTNLFDNSLRYVPPGGRIRCAVRPEDGGTWIEVSDTGPGLSRDHLPRIFERFYRVDPSRSREEGGTGLGLSIVKHLAEAHGGQVAAESELGHGLTVRCWFPAEGEDQNGA